MTDSDDAQDAIDERTEATSASVPTAIAADYKVLGYNSSTSGTPYGVMGTVDSASGFGLYTPGDAKMDG